jgi:hypothetical protein
VSLRYCRKVGLQLLVVIAVIGAIVIAIRSNRCARRESYREGANWGYRMGTRHETFIFHDDETRTQIAFNDGHDPVKNESLTHNGVTYVWDGWEWKNP